MRIKFSHIVGLSAFMLAVTSGYYSVFGLSQLFAGASLAVIIMASSLEFSKVIAVSMLEKYWNRIGGALKVYLIVGVIILVCITSAGIYGFLSNAYQKTASNLEVTEAGLNVLNNKKGLFEKGINDNQKIIEYKKNRAQQLSNLRDRQEGRIDAAVSNSNKGRARADIDAASKEVQTLNNEIDVLNQKNAVLLDSVNVYANKVIDAKAKGNSTSEIGPLKYLAQLTGYPMDKVINWFILLLIFVFDPLAVALVIATNKVLEFEKEDSDKKENKEKPYIQSLTPKNIEEPEVIEHEYEPEPEIPNERLETPYVSDDFQIGPDGAYEHIYEGVNKESIIELPVVEEAKVESVHKKDFVIPTGKIEVEDIKEKKEQTNRGFSTNIPHPKSNTIQRIGSNKYRGG